MKPEYQALLDDAIRGWKGKGHWTGTYWAIQDVNEGYVPENVIACCFLGAVGLARNLSFKGLSDIISNNAVLRGRITRASDNADSKEAAIEAVRKVLEEASCE